MESNIITAKIAGFSRLRVETDGPGIRTLVHLSRCPLLCRYCLNPELRSGRPGKPYAPEWLLRELKQDDVYFRASGGGVTYGGGEPACWSDFIERFRSICPEHWTIAIETSLNVLPKHVEQLSGCTDYWIVDIKDMDEDIYHRYTGVSNKRVLSNLQYLGEHVPKEQVLVRVPHIPYYNMPSDVVRSVKMIEEMGFRTDTFIYRTAPEPLSENGDPDFIVNAPALMGELIEPRTIGKGKTEKRKTFWKKLVEQINQEMTLMGYMECDIKTDDENEYNDWD